MLKFRIGLAEPLGLVVAGPTSCTAEITVFSKLYVSSEWKHTPQSRKF